MNMFDILTEAVINVIKLVIERTITTRLRAVLACGFVGLLAAAAWYAIRVFLFVAVGGFLAWWVVSWFIRKWS